MITAGLCPEENSAEGRAATPGFLLAEILAATLGLQSRFFSAQNVEVGSALEYFSPRKNVYIVDFFLAKRGAEMTSSLSRAS